MDKATQTMFENLHKNTGKTLDEWIGIIINTGMTKHGEIVKHLKEKHGFTHGFANMVALKALKSDAGSADNQDDLIENQYKGKEHFKTLYSSIIKEINSFGNDIEIAPKNNYVSLRRKIQFAILEPKTKTRFEIGINLKGQEESGKLIAIKSANSMCSHKINLESEADFDGEVINWLRKAYQNS